MKRLGPAIVAVSALVAAGAGVATAGATGGGTVLAARAVVPAAGSWGTAIEVPGLAALNKGGSAHVFSVSCASAGKCAAVGDYKDGLRHYQGFVVSERHGRWGRAVEVPGLAALNSGGSAEVGSVSCGSAGNCAAGGFYTYGSHNDQGFVVDEQDGVWGTAVEVPGLGTLNSGGSAQVLSVSCGSAGNCVAGGYYMANHFEPFVVTEKNGIWGKAIEVPGLSTLNAGGGFTNVDSVSCAPAGGCAAGGFYADLSHHAQGFIVTQAR